MPDYLMHLFCDALSRDGPACVLVHFSAKNDAEAESQRKRFKKLLNDRTRPPRFSEAAQQSRRLRRLVEVARTLPLGE